jgi:hypothetical protein
MSDELERRLRAAGHRLPGPAETDTERARGRLLATPPRLRRRTLLPALVAAVALGGAFGVGYAVASGGGGETRVVREPLNAGPGFLPAQGWQTTADPAAARATAVNDPLGVRLEATFGSATPSSSLPQAVLPLRLDATKRRVHVRVAAWDVDVRIDFRNESQAALVAAREELGRLVVPACPIAQELRDGDVAAATRYVLAWLPAHYSGDAADLPGAIGTAAAGRDMPRYGQASYYCGANVAERTIEVDVVLPKVAKVSASLSQLTYFVAREPDGLVVWQRAR